MYLGNEYITPGQRVSNHAPRFDMRLAERCEDEESLSPGWTWVAALLVAAMFIVSGYLDEESRNFDGATVSGVVKGYAQNTVTPTVVAANSPGTDRHSAKGY